MIHSTPFDSMPVDEALGRAWRYFLWTVLAIITVFALGACATTSNVPPPPPPAQKVLVPVTKPCEVEKVENSALPSAGGVPDDLFEAVKRVLADRSVLLADREKLQAANTAPCPEVQP